MNTEAVDSRALGSKLMKDAMTERNELARLIVRRTKLENTLGRQLDPNDILNRLIETQEITYDMTLRCLRRVDEELWRKAKEIHPPNLGPETSPLETL